MRFRVLEKGSRLALILMATVVLFGFGALSQTDAPLPDLSGRWVTVQRLVAIADLPFLGEVTFLTTVGLFTEIAQSGSQVALLDAYCFTDVDTSTALFVTDISDATMRSIRPEPRVAELRVEGGTTWFAHDWHTEVRGAVLDDPVNDPLPTDRDDPRVIDQEGDGWIGFTIPAEIIGMFGGDTYVVQRFRYRLRGRLVDLDTILGIVEWTTEQVILSASNPLMMMSYTQRIACDPTVHRFLMRRIDRSWSCESIRERLAPLLEILDAADLS